MIRERPIVAILLLSSLIVRAIHADQPIVENYVGRQVPTAMVARNLDRGSGFLHPTLDTGPFPNEFLVEPPIYASLVAVFHQITGLGWEASGRLTSAIATTLGGWAFFGLVRRRQGKVVATIATVAFIAFPVMTRYGRAFQPDALMLGLVLIGLRAWDEWQATGRSRWAWAGGAILATGLAVKVTASWTLIPFYLLARRWPPAFRIMAGLAMLAPAFAWYAYAGSEVHRQASSGLDRSGSLASADNAAIWIRTLDPSAWLRFSTWDAIGRNLFHRAFTPVGIALALLGWLTKRSQLADAKRTQASDEHLDRLADAKRTQASDAKRSQSDCFWTGWVVGVSLAVVALGPKWHHGYYWMVLAPPVAVGVGLALGSRPGGARWGQLMRWGVGLGLIAACAWQSASTYRTPAEWASIADDARRVASVVGEDDLLIAPEAMLYQADRRGMRMEFSPESAQRAAGEWGGALPIDALERDPLALVDFYAAVEVARPGKGNFIYPEKAGFFADVGPATDDPRRLACRDALRARDPAGVLIDEPRLFVARVRKGAPR